MKEPENLNILIEAIESISGRKSLSDGWLREHGGLELGNGGDLNGGQAVIDV